MVITKSDEEFIKNKLMPWARVRRVYIARSNSKKKWPDLWVTFSEIPKITVTDEWKKQGVHERRKRLTHEFLHLQGLDHNESIGYSTHPEKDAFSKMVYMKLITK